MTAKARDAVTAFLDVDYVANKSSPSLEEKAGIS